jgi:hypothetical protein
MEHFLTSYRPHTNTTSSSGGLNTNNTSIPAPVPARVRLLPSISSVGGAPPPLNMSPSMAPQAIPPTIMAPLAMAGVGFGSNQGNGGIIPSGSPTLQSHMYSLPVTSMVPTSTNVGPIEMTPPSPSFVPTATPPPPPSMISHRQSSLSSHRGLTISTRPLMIRGYSGNGNDPVTPPPLVSPRRSTISSNNTNDTDRPPVTPPPRVDEEVTDDDDSVIPSSINDVSSTTSNATGMITGSSSPLTQRSPLRRASTVHSVLSPTGKRTIASSRAGEVGSVSIPITAPIASTPAAAPAGGGLLSRLPAPPRPFTRQSTAMKHLRDVTPLSSTPTMRVGSPSINSPRIVAGSTPTPASAVISLSSSTSSTTATSGSAMTPSTSISGRGGNDITSINDIDVDDDVAPAGVHHPRIVFSQLPALPPQVHIHTCMTFVLEPNP